MTLETFLEAECAKSKSAWFHKSELPALFEKYLKSKIKLTNPSLIVEGEDKHLLK